MSKMERKFENKKIKRKSKLEFFFRMCATERETKESKSKQKKIAVANNQHETSMRNV